MKTRSTWNDKLEQISIHLQVYAALIVGGWMFTMFVIVAVLS